MANVEHSTLTGADLHEPKGIASVTDKGKAYISDGSGSGDWAWNVPVGAVLDYAGTTAPDGYHLCYGQAVSRTTYAKLFAILSTTFGSGDGSTTFNLPDLRGRVVAGQDDMGGTSANRLTTPLNGDTFGAAGGAETDSHDHGGQTGTPTSNQGCSSGGVNVGSNNHRHSITSDDTSTVQPTLILNKIIYHGVF